MWLTQKTAARNWSRGSSVAMALLLCSFLIACGGGGGGSAGGATAAAGSSGATGQAAAVTSVQVTATKSTLAPGESTSLAATVKDAGGKMIPVMAAAKDDGVTVTWSSTNPTVVAVEPQGQDTSEAIAKGVAPGSAVIIAAVKDKTGTATLTVVQAAQPATPSTQTSSTSAADTTSPSAPASLAATVISSSQITLTWSASTDNVGVTGYKVFRGGVLLTTVATTTYPHTGLADGATSCYTVAAVDAAGNASGQSAQACATTTDITPPSTPTGLTATAVSESRIDLAWAASTDNVAVTGYTLYRSGLGHAMTTGPSYSDTGLLGATTYCYTVAAFDAAGHFSGQSSQACATTPADLTPPTAPPGLIATAVSSSEISLVWSASTDNVGVTGYRVESCQGAGCTAFVEFVQPTGTSDWVGGLTAGTTYSYRVRARDAAGNLSAYSATATATTLLPAPTGLIAALGNGQLTVSWNAVGGAQSYTLLMATKDWTAWTADLPGAMVHANLTTTTFLHTALTNRTTYWFAVTASNGSRESAESALISARPSPSLTAGEYHTCGLTTAGAVLCWGRNSSGQLGDGTTTNRLTSVVVSGLTSQVTAVAAGSGHTCALTTAGGVQCWGANGSGQLGNGSTTNSTTPAAVSGLTTGAVALGAGAAHTCARLSDSTVKCWGSNAFGQLGDGTLTSALTPVAASGLTSVTAIAAGAYHTCALTTGGAVQCWGRNTYGQLGDDTTLLHSTAAPVFGLPAITAITAGWYHTCALTTAGGVKCWGSNSDGQLGDGTFTNRSRPVWEVSGLVGGAGILVAGGLHTCALTVVGAVKCWGWNLEGQLGDGTTTDRLTATPISGLTSGVAPLAAGGLHTCALMTAGGAQCWGANDSGQLGDGTTTTRLTPVAVSGF